MPCVLSTPGKATNGFETIHPIALRDDRRDLHFGVKISYNAEVEDHRYRAPDQFGLIAPPSICRCSANASYREDSRDRSIS